LSKRDRDPPLVAPHGAAAADELIALDQQRERPRQIGAARSIAAPLEDRLRIVQAMPLPSKAIVAPFSTLYRLAARFSTIVTNPKCRLAIRNIAKGGLRSAESQLLIARTGFSFRLRHGGVKTGRRFPQI
jgi:hypothetical protein